MKEVLKQYMMPICLTMITIVDIIWGTKGMIGVALWICFGFYKLLIED